MATPVQLLYRRLGTDGSPMRGQGQQNFLTNLEAVAQAVLTRIRLLFAEWFENESLGTPLFQSILGVPQTEEGVALIMQQRILTLAPYVTGVKDIVVTYTGDNRAFTFSCTVQTIFGTIAVVSPQPQS